MQNPKSDDLAFHAATWNEAPVGAPTMVWGHGWGQSGPAFSSLVDGLKKRANHVVFDFPGFGETPQPPAVWDTADYADAVVREIERRGVPSPFVWAGHSFGGRVGIQLAARHPESVSGLVLMACAGLPRKRSLTESITRTSRIFTYKSLRRAAPLLGLDTDALRARFGSADYANAGAMREILVKVVNEDLSDQARAVTCPVALIYGANDTDTPPEIGERLTGLMPKADLTVLDGFDHFTILTTARHQVVPRIVRFLEATR